MQLHTAIDGHGHWLTISTIGATKDANVFVNVSLFRFVTPFVKQQIASILFTECSTIDLKIMDVQMPAGNADCGLFAIAFATALVSGVLPGSRVFEQKEMRKHLHDCLQQGRPSVFPTAKQRRTALHAKLKTADSSHVFCICKMHELKIAMLKCSQCGMLYHIECTSALPLSVKRGYNWSCSICNQA